MNFKESLEAEFGKGKIDPQANELIAVSFLYEYLPSKNALIGSRNEQYHVKGENSQTREMRFMLSKIIPGYKPHILPRGILITKNTVIVGRQLKSGESLESSYIHSLHAQMLAKALKKKSVDKKLMKNGYTALSISGESVATGRARIAVVARAADKGM